MPKKSDRHIMEWSENLKMTEENDMEKKELLNNGRIQLFSSVIGLANGFRLYLDNRVDKIGINILYIRLGVIIALMVLCIVAFIYFFTMKMWKYKQKTLTILLLIVSAGLVLLESSSLVDCCADLAGGTKSVVTNDYPVVWDKIYLSSIDEDYAYVSDDIAKYLNENKILAVTTNFDIERESYVEVTYYPNTHILISAEVVR